MVVNSNDTNPQFTIPVIRGIQAGCEYYTAMFDVRMVIKFFRFTDEELPPELRAQRLLFEPKAKNIAKYIVGNPSSYVLPAMTASIDAELEFSPISENSKMGVLTFPIDASLVINDGQHRKRALELALENNPQLAYETISVTLFVDRGLKRAQQIFSDINKNAKPTPKSLNILYDHRDSKAQAIRSIVAKIPVFQRHTEMENNTVGKKTNKLFVLRHLHDANVFVMAALDRGYTFDVSFATKYWQAVAFNMVDWQEVFSREVKASEVRVETISTQAVTLSALGRLGEWFASNFVKNPDDMQQQLSGLKAVDWSRNNPDWVGRCLEDGKLVKNARSEKAVVRYLKLNLGIPLDSDEQQLEGNDSGSSVAGAILSSQPDGSDPELDVSEEGAKPQEEQVSSELSSDWKEAKTMEPCLRSYLDAKDAHPDKIVFVPVGDFYETFDEDAKLVADLLEFVLTSKKLGDANNGRIPMTGIPTHAITRYCSLLEKAGYRVMIVGAESKIICLGQQVMYFPNVGDSALAAWFGFEYVTEAKKFLKDFDVAFSLGKSEIKRSLTRTGCKVEVELEGDLSIPCIKAAAEKVFGWSGEDSVTS